MLELVISEKYGDGAMLGVTPEKTRVVPFLDVTAPGAAPAGLQTYEGGILKDLATTGFSVRTNVAG